MTTEMHPIMHWISSHSPALTDWTLASLKVIGLVGAYIGLAERIDRKEHPSRLRKVIPVLFLIIAMAAEFVDADIKHRESVEQEVHYDRILNPVNRITGTIQLTIPYERITKLSATYGAKVQRYTKVDVVKNEGWMEFDQKSADYPNRKVQDEHKIWQALNAFYDTRIVFFTTEALSDADEGRSKTIHSDFAIELNEQKKVYVGGGWATETDMEYPPPARELQFTPKGIAINDPPTTIDLNALSPTRHIRSVGDLAGSALSVRVCPEVEDWNGEPQEQDLAALIRLEKVDIDVEGIGLLELKASSLSTMKDSVCIKYFYRFPKSREETRKLFLGV